MSYNRLTYAQRAWDTCEDIGLMERWYGPGNWRKVAKLLIATTKMSKSMREKLLRQLEFGEKAVIPQNTPRRVKAIADYINCEFDGKKWVCGALRRTYPR